MFVAPIYNRSELLSFYDLPEDTQIDLTKDLEHDSEELNRIHDDNYIRFDYTSRTEYLALSNFMRFDYAGGKPNPIWDGYFGTSYFSCYFIKYNRSNDGVLIAEKYC